MYCKGDFDFLAIGIEKTLEDFGPFIALGCVRPILYMLLSYFLSFSLLQI